MKRFFIMVIALTLVLSMAPTSFAADNSTAEEPVIVEGQDIFFQIDDMGIYDLINSIDDPVKKTKIEQYWYEPAYIVDQEYNEKEQKEIFKLGLKKIQYLISVPTDSLDNEINKYLQADVINMKNNTNAKILPSFISEVKNRNLLYADELSKKAVKEEDLTLIVDTNTILPSRSSSLSTKSIIPMKAKKTYGVVNSTAAGSRWITCTTNWQYNSSTGDIVYLVPSTSVGSVFPAMCTQSFDPSRQVIINNYVGTTDYAFVHKRSICSDAGGYPNPIGELIIDFQLRGNGTSTLYAGYVPYGSHIWSGPY